MDVKVLLNYDSCHGHQMCAVDAPEVFGSGEIDNAKVLITGEIPAALHVKVRRAESNCPERAITIIE